MPINTTEEQGGRGHTEMKDLPLIMSSVTSHHLVVWSPQYKHIYTVTKNTFVEAFVLYFS